MERERGYGRFGEEDRYETWGRDDHRRDLRRTRDWEREQRFSRPEWERDDDWRSRGEDWRSRGEWRSREGGGMYGSQYGQYGGMRGGYSGMDRSEHEPQFGGMGRYDYEPQHGYGAGYGIRGGGYGGGMGREIESQFGRDRERYLGREGRERDWDDDDRSLMERMGEGARRFGESVKRTFRGERGPFWGKGPKGYRRSDERIREDVCERIAMHGWIDASDVDIKVQNGEVILSGTVPERWHKRMLEDIAEDLHGVDDVRNELRVKRELPERTMTKGTEGGERTRNARQS